METGRGLGEDHACDRRTSSKAECWDLFHLHPLSHMPNICFLPVSLYKLKKYTILTVLHVCLIGDWFKDVIDRVGGHIGLPLSNLILLFFTFPTTTTTTRTCVLCGVCICMFCVWQYIYVCLSLLENNVFVFQQWYTSTMNLLGTWLTDRMDLQLHVYQLKILIRVVKVNT